MAYVPVQNQSVSGTVGSSIIGLPPVALNVGGNPVTTTNPVPVQPPASGSLPITNVGSVITVSQGSVATVIIGGSIAASFTPPANQSVSGTVQTDVRGSVATVIIGGSIAASFTPPANQSVSGTVQTDVMGSVATVIIGGSILTTTGNSSVQVLNFPANQSVSGAISVSNFPTTQNVSGSVVAFPTGQYTVVSSIAGGIFPISGSVAAVVTNFPATQVVNFQNSSIIAYQLAGSVLATSATVNPAANQSVSGTVGASVIGTVPVTQSGTQITSLVSTVPSSVIFGASIFGTAPVTQAGTWIASVFGNVSVIGTVPVTQSGSWTTSVFTATPGTAIRYSGSTVSTSVTLIAASAAGKRNYITDFWISNTGASTTLLTFKDGSTSVLGYTIAPTGGGSNAPGITTPMVAAASQDLTFQNTTATSILYVTVNGYQI